MIPSFRMSSWKNRKYTIKKVIDDLLCLKITLTVSFARKTIYLMLITKLHAQRSPPEFLMHSRKRSKQLDMTHRSLPKWSV